MSPEQWIKARWIFGSIFAVLAAMITLLTYQGRKKNDER
jgi:hypothetical protein